jgi:general secretion pathway protein E/type IV pilus assembly protein PilB
LKRSVGCRACRQVGYSGRLGIYELLVTTERIRNLAHDRSSSWEIHKAGIEEGMLTLRQDGWLKVLDGRSSVEEVVRVTKSDRL